MPPAKGILNAWPKEGARLLPMKKNTLVAAIAEAFRKASMVASIRISCNGARLIRGKRSFLRYQARYGWHV
jgi:hypothetical protein